MDIRGHNRKAWDRSVERGIRWTQPVSSQTIDRARQGEFEVHLTPTKPVPNEWLPELFASNVLCLASAGGQQAPILAAVGAVVTVFDNSPKQLAQDQLVAKRDGLKLNVAEGDMADLSAFENECFDLIFHPCSNAFVSDVIPVWQECFRVLKRGGLLLAGFTNPMRYIFDDERKENGNLEVRYSIP
jgi:SAM-dependent methyltransferase